ncbi:response regulator [Blastopirellula sp. JC732]|uniref:Response regulator n=1 Tax=Blastopirellula sediminis TaxID=2894196 RepID=A0A9X1MR40_9BACT|nr:response regulator [Blastopirellula sediminis]MCC9605871.1 response regulator [Blastopirellula sediminis]MCC9630830.1 response regulator [Blastopirellula sediminis]
MSSPEQDVRAESPQPGGLYVTGYDEIRILVVDDNPVDRTLIEGLLANNNRGNLQVALAASGEEGLRAIPDFRPDVVLTDMQMPGMDGLELVERIREQFPLIPAVLMTAFGSEELAITALQRGAASYVPKRNLAASLMETLGKVLASAHHDRQQARLGQCWSQTEFHFVLENDVQLIGAVTAHVQHYLKQFRHLDDSQLLRVGIALDEAIRNAMHHGNLELSSSLKESGGDRYFEEAARRRSIAPYHERRVFFTARELGNESHYIVRDEGPGFDVSKVHYDPEDIEQLTRPSGRGLFLIRTFMDDVRFNEHGNEITMIFRRTDSPAKTEAAPAAQ